VTSSRNADAQQSYLDILVELVLEPIERELPGGEELVRVGALALRALRRHFRSNRPSKKKVPHGPEPPQLCLPF
jgi:hypothetical protein